MIYVAFTAGMMGCALLMVGAAQDWDPMIVGPIALALYLLALVLIIKDYRRNP